MLFLIVTTGFLLQGFNMPCSRNAECRSGNCVVNPLTGIGQCKNSCVGLQGGICCMVMKCGFRFFSEIRDLSGGYLGSCDNTADCVPPMICLYDKVFQGKICQYP